MPTVFGCGGSFLFIHASPQACHSLSRHIGLPAATMHIQPFVPARNCFICPSAPAAMTVACLPISGGAALTALAIAAASDCPLPFAIASWLDFAFGLVGFALSCAEAAQLTASTRTPVTAATVFCIGAPPQCKAHEKMRTLLCH